MHLFILFSTISVFYTILSDCDIIFLLHGERRLTGVLSTPTMSLTPASAGADAKWHHDNGFYLRDSADADASMRDVGTQSNRDGTIVHSSL